MTDTPRTRNRVDLAEAVHRELGFSRTHSADLVESVLQHISDALVEDGKVKISSFATFEVYTKPERIGRNPKTGVLVPIEPRKVVRFRPSSTMNTTVEEGNRSQ